MTEDGEESAVDVPTRPIEVTRPIGGALLPGADPGPDPWYAAADHRSPDLEAVADDLPTGFQQEVERVVAQTLEGRLHTALVSLGEQMVSDPDLDLVGLLRSIADVCVELFGADAAGVLLEDDEHRLVPVASSEDDDRVLELARLAADTGLCQETRATGESRTIPDVAALQHRWPRFAVAAERCGFASVHVAPVRLQDGVAGCLLLLGTRHGGPAPGAAAAVQALCTVAALGVLLDRPAGRTAPAPDRLEQALESRVLIEQAKGVLAQRDGISLDAALTALQVRAQRTGAAVRDVAQDLVARASTGRDLLDGEPPAASADDQP